MPIKFDVWKWGVSLMAWKGGTLLKPPVIPAGDEEPDPYADWLWLVAVVDGKSIGLGRRNPNSDETLDQVYRDKTLSIGRDTYEVSGLPYLMDQEDGKGTDLVVICGRKVGEIDTDLDAIAMERVFGRSFDRPEDEEEEEDEDNERKKGW